MNEEKRVKQLKKYSNSGLIRLVIQLEKTIELLEKEQMEKEKNEV